MRRLSFPPLANLLALTLWLTCTPSPADESSDSRSDSQTKPAAKLKVFLLAGQSNMQGHAHVDTLEAMKFDPSTAPLLAELRQPDGTPRTSDHVYISSIGSADEEQIGPLTTGFGAHARGPKIGPEFSFGLTIEKHLENPILLIKTAWGGKSLHTDFRPPGAAPYTFSEAQLENIRKQDQDLEKAKAEKQEASGQFYRLMIDHINQVLANPQRVYPGYDPDAGYELSGFVWFQGWNDMVDRGTYPNRDQDGGYDAYSELLAQFIRDVRRDLNAPSLPFVIGVLGVGGPVADYPPSEQRYANIHQNFRDAMAAPAALPEFQGNVAAVRTENFWDMKVMELREKEKTIKPRLQEIEEAVKAGNQSRQDGSVAMEDLYRELFTPRELKILRTSTSNFDFHYMGSAKIMALIGQGFAQAMLSLLEKE